MAISANIFKAILSFDSYNRGYNAGIDIDGNHQDQNYCDDSSGQEIGSATILSNSGDLNPAAGIDNDIGLYGVAYEYNGETIIAYRGTDSLLVDPVYGWPTGGGAVGTAQADMAFS